LTAPKVRVVKRDDSAGLQPQEAPQSDGFEGVALSNLPDTMRAITSENFHVLLFADAGLRPVEDRGTLIRSVLHGHPIAFTVVPGDSPAQDARLRADLAHTDEITSKSVTIGFPHQRIHNHLDFPKTHRRMKPESVASLLARELELTIHNWIDLVEEAAELKYISRSSGPSPGLLPKLLAGLILRRKLVPAATRSVPIAAGHHGEVCRKFGYTSVRVERESRKLPVGPLRTLQRNLHTADLGSVFPSTMAIADEIDFPKNNCRRFTMRL
jgi:hypothetical protein